jgi:hypothetical protein
MRLAPDACYGGSVDQQAGLISLAPLWKEAEEVLLRKITSLLAALVVMVVMAVPALAVPPEQNEHNCYGYSNSRGVQGEPIPPPTPVAEHPGNEVAEFQQGAREQFANCGANEGVVPTTAE